jgi:hypothetical protein
MNTNQENGRTALDVFGIVSPEVECLLGKQTLKQPLLFRVYWCSFVVSFCIVAA